MKQARIVFITVEGTPHTLRLDQPESMAALSDGERAQLIALLEAVKAAPQGHATSTSEASAAPVSMPERQPSLAASVSIPERLGSGDLDARVSQLMAQERENHQPQITVQTMYKWVAVAAAIGIVLILIL